MKVFYFEEAEIWGENISNTKNIYFTKEIFVPKHYTGRYPSRKISINPFFITAGHVYVDTDYPLQNNRLRSQYVRKYMYKGATLVITRFQIKNNHFDWRRDFHQYVRSLQGLAIDYMVVPQMHISYLTVDMVRFFGIMKVPFILVECNRFQKLSNFHIQWLRHIQSLVPIPLAVLKGEGDWFLEHLKESQVIVLKHPISSLPLQKEDLKLTGISPKKGEITNYGDTDFNLYVKNNKKEKSNIDEYPYISVMRGNMIKLNQTVMDKRGLGQYCTISIQNHF